MARLRLCVLIYVVAVGLVKNGFGDAGSREECTTTDCMKTVSNFVETILWPGETCDRFYHYSCSVYRGASIPPETHGHELTALAHQLNNLKLKTSPSCPWPNCATRHEDRAAAEYEYSCSKQDGTSGNGLKDIIDLLNEATKIEKWTDLENWSVSRGLQSSFFKTYRASDESFTYHELVADGDPPTQYIQNDTPVAVDPDTVIIDPRPDDTVFNINDDDRVVTYVRLLNMAGLDHALELKLLDGFYTSSRLDQKLIEAHKKTNPEEHVLNFFRHRYTRDNPKEKPAVRWQHLWDCGVYNIYLPRETICEVGASQKFDWTSYFRDHYWGSVAVAGDLVPLLERDLPEHWVVAPYLIPTINNAFQSYSNQQLKNFILWRMAKQLLRHADTMTKSTLRLRGSYYDCHSTFSRTIMRLKARYEWYDRFPEHTRRQIYTMWSDVNFQMKYLRYKRLYKKGKDQDVEDMKTLILMDYTNTEYYPQFPHASKYIEPSVFIKPSQTNRTALDIALNLQKVERALLLRLTRVEYTYEDTYFLTEILGTEGFEKFMENRPASLNYGALGSSIGYHLLTRFIEPWRYNLNFFNNYRICLDKNFPGFVGNNATKLYELASITFGVEAAWHAYEQHVAVYGDKNLRMPLGIAGEVSDGDIVEYDNKKLFFASLGNSLCGSNRSPDLIDVALKMLPQFREAFECGPTHDGVEWFDCQFD